jgi:oligopeptide transport system substrate-binding protein
MGRKAGIYKKKTFSYRGRALFKILPLVFALVLFSSCSELEKPKPEPFYAQTAPPAKQEFRWSNGKMPKTLDPALVSAPPETDVVRAIFDGLTEMDARTLEAVPAVAEKWTASEDSKTWTFYLRKDTKWSNGKSVTAHDFVSSWKRVVEMEKTPPRSDLFQNIVGMDIKRADTPPAPTEEPNVFLDPLSPPASPLLNDRENANSSAQRTQADPIVPDRPANPVQNTEKPDTKPGVEAIDDHTLRVSLIKPDKQFPRLVANPVFRPVYAGGEGFEPGKLRSDIVTNGAFRVSSIGQDGITLDRAEYYWNRAAVQLERVKFVPKESAEQALEAYRAGELDAVTNANFEPLALKLLAPYEDFRQTKHSALNFYEFNLERPPFNDHRVREALAIAIERERLTEGEMEGSSQPAVSFLPFGESGEPKLVQDVEKAKMLLADAGFPDGEKFPVIELVVNRNDAQQRIARSVAKMWKQNLNIETEVSVKEPGEIEKIRGSGAFDMLRRGVVLPTSDETANMLAIFAPPDEGAGNVVLPGSEVLGIPLNPETSEPGGESGEPQASPEGAAAENEQIDILTDEDAMRELSAIPLYFPTSYSLVKSYVQGFEINALDAPSLKDVRIDTDWQPKKAKSES